MDKIVLLDAKEKRIIPYRENIIKDQAEINFADNG